MASGSSPPERAGVEWASPIHHELTCAALCSWWDLDRYRGVRAAWRLARGEARKLTERAEARRGR